MIHDFKFLISDYKKILKMSTKFIKLRFKTHAKFIKVYEDRQNIHQKLIVQFYEEISWRIIYFS